ncbi:hypothetical protein BDV95DRAFT_588020 [Massariosphaeria phaeospora]|uniref:NmrA-like domain-containing protein n=1 Tax=Massariosphaeria phaeospora TaxID=100035 RepID=A0A7C8I0X3_9PLEO|nr:hypothetical protein BDV95DRAFT_588020 [Massariosphaeria phaeospora]
MKTFIPSEYGINYTTDLLAFHPAAKYFLDAADALRASHLNFTRVILGWTLDHYGMPHVQSHMKPFKYVLDFDNHRAALPGDGETPVTFLHSADLAKYVAAMLKQDSWPETSAFVADRMSWKEMVRVAEWVTGNNWNVTYDSIETLHNGEATLFDQPEGSYTEYPKEELRKLVSEFGLMVVNGIVDVSGVGTRNAEFPEIRPVTVEEIIERAWGGEVRHRK